MIYAENIFICIVIPLVISLLFTKQSARRFTVFFLLGMTCCLLSAYISAFLAGVNEFDAQNAALYISPTVEEMVCLIPMLFYFVLFAPQNEEVFLAAVGIGVGFSTFENCCYILSNSASNLSFMLVRGFSAGVMHLVCAILIVLGLALLRRIPAAGVACVAGMLTFAVSFHAIYNLCVSESGIVELAGYVLPMAGALLLYFFYRNSELLRDEASKK